jgi:hypothetical protein
MIKDNFESVLTKIRNLVDTWILRKLTIKGKVLIVNTLLVTQLIYICTVIQTPEWVTKEYNSMIHKFIWNGKPAKVKYNCLVNTIDEGGLKLQDLSAKIKACQMVWIKRMIDREYDAPWKSYANSLFAKDDIQVIPYYNMEACEFNKIQNEFYRNLFKNWADIHYYTPTNGEQVCRELLWSNSHIKIGNKIVHYKNWKEHNIRFIHDLINEQGQISSKQDLEQKFVLDIAQMEYNALLSAIPKKWKALITEDPNCRNYNVFLDCKLIINENIRKLEETHTVDIYRNIICSIKQRPSSETKWEEKTGLNLDNQRLGKNI